MAIWWQIAARGREFSRGGILLGTQEIRKKNLATDGTDCTDEGGDSGSENL
jgi:hypothetical protein